MALRGNSRGGIEFPVIEVQRTDSVRVAILRLDRCEL
jgi:hypothetical protein